MRNHVNKLQNMYYLIFENQKYKFWMCESEVHNEVQKAIVDFKYCSSNIPENQNTMD